MNQQPAKAPALPVNKTAERIWRNRIVGHGEVDPKELLANPRNWRTHPPAQQEALLAVLKGVGWVQDVIVNRRSGFVVDGHARIDLALQAKEKVPVKYVDLSEEEEALILASLDPITSMAITDELALRPLLEQAKTDSAVLDALLHSLVDEAALTAIQDAEEESEQGQKALTRQLTNDASVVKAVFTVSDLRIVERAIRAVSNPSRGSAVVAICEAYLETHGDQAAAKG